MIRRWQRNLVAIALIALTLFTTTCVSTNDDDDFQSQISQMIAQTCAPKSRSRHTVNVDSLSLACSDADGYNVGNGYYYPYAKNSMSTSCSAGNLAQVTLDCTYLCASYIESNMGDLNVLLTLVFCFSLFSQFYSLVEKIHNW
jgi:hypothetical protein